MPALPPGPAEADAPRASPLSLVLIALLKGVCHRDDDPALWQSLLAVEAPARDHLAVLGLELMLDDAEGYAYLRQHPAAVGEPELPRLVARRQLSYPVSLLLVLLRKKLVELDAGGGGTRLILSREQIAEMMRLFFPDSTNEARLLERLDANLEKVVELGFLHRLKGSEDQFEVRRLLKGFVDAQWLQDFNLRLAAYRAQHAAGAPGPS